MDNISFVSPESALKSEFTFNFSDLIQDLTFMETFVIIYKILKRFKSCFICRSWVEDLTCQI